MLASFAEVTERVEIGALVTCNSYRNPELLADMARTVDHISGGRLILGHRLRLVREGLRRVRLRIRRRPVGRLEDLDAMPAADRVSGLAKLDPAPTRDMPDPHRRRRREDDPPLRRRHADIWHGFGEPEVIAHKNEVLDDWCAKEGRDPAEIERSVGIEPKHFDKAEAFLEAGSTQFTIGLNVTWKKMLAISGGWSMAMLLGFILPPLFFPYLRYGWDYSTSIFCFFIGFFAGALGSWIMFWQIGRTTITGDQGES